MKVISTAISEIKIIIPRKYNDERGFFSEIYNRLALSEQGIDVIFLQDNCSFSQNKGTLRGLHFQTPPFAQHKLVRVSRGAIFDVAVDIRVGSPTYSKHVAVILSANEWNQLWIPEGFAHGFCTLEDRTEVIYKVTNFYNPTHDSGIFWADPDLGINWPVLPDAAILSVKDQSLPLFKDLPPLFI